MSSEGLGQKLNPDWWYLHGKAYNFSPFVKRHPGGVQAIELGKGRDCTALFESYHTNLPNADFLEKYAIENTNNDYLLKTTKNLFTFDEKGFYRTVKQRAKIYFKENGYENTKGGWGAVFWWFVNLFGYIMGVYLAFICGSSIGAIIYGVSKSLLVIRSTHAASHFSFSIFPKLNRFVYWFNMALCGDTPAQWTAKHVIAHHIDTNITPEDDDTMYPIKRVLKTLPRQWFHNYQHIYIWLLYVFVYYPWTLSHNIKIILGIFYGRIFEGIVEVRLNNTLDWIETISAILFHHFIRLLPFIMLNTWTSAFFIALIAELASSLWFSLQFAVNHETPESVELAILDEKMMSNHRDFGMHQLITSHNYSPQYWLALHLSGGLNYQIEHHLFPSVHYKFYPDLGKIVEKTAKEFGLPYNCSGTFVTGVKKHYELLKTMGQND